MKAVQFHEYGGPDVLRYEDTERPTPGPGQVLIKVASTSFNPVDASIRAGFMQQAMPVRLPHIPGIDVAGTVVEGDGWTPDQAVIGSVLARLLVATGAAFDATMVAADGGLRADLLAVAAGPGQRLDVIDPTDDLPKLLADADVAVSASGTSTWELLCLGLPAALVQVVDNQILGYERTIGRGLAAGLGRLQDLPSPAATAALRTVLTEPAARAGLAARAWAAVDGQGAARVADALLAAVTTAPRSPHRSRSPH